MFKSWNTANLQLSYPLKESLRLSHLRITSLVKTIQTHLTQQQVYSILSNERQNYYNYLQYAGTRSCTFNGQ